MTSEQEQLDLCESALSLAGAGRSAAIDLCAALDLVYERRAYEVSQYGDERTFLEELGMSPSSVIKYRAIGRMARALGIPKARLLAVRNMESLYLAARQPDPADTLRLLEAGEHLTFRDLKLTASKADECAHEWRTLALRCCDRCGLKEKEETKDD